MSPSADGDMQTIELSTDENGYFFGQVPGEKEYDVFIYADGYWVEHDAFNLSQGEHQVISVGIAQMSQASRLYGTIRDGETGDLISYAEVNLNCEQACSQFKFTSAYEIKSPVSPSLIVP